MRSKVSHTPVEGEFFEIHGNEFKLDPFGDLEQASVLREAHGVFFFCVGKNPLDRLFAKCI